MKDSRCFTKNCQSRKSISGGWIITLLILTFFMGACTSRYQKDDQDLETLLASYRAQNEKMATRRAEALKRGIEQLDIIQPDKIGEPVKVSVDLRNARLDVVVKLILDGAKTEYINQNHIIPGTVTAHFENRPLVEALTILLGKHGMKASRSGALIILELDPSKSKLGQAIATLPEEDTEVIHIDWPLENISITRAIDVLTNIYPIDEDTDKRDVNFAAHTESNSVIVSGTHVKVEDAIRLLSKIDQDSGHVLLEALVVEFNVDSFIDLGTRLEAGASGEFSDISFDVANLVGNTLSFTRVSDAANTSSFTAMLNLLIEDEEARIVSRPYLSTVSGTSATLEVAEDRFVVVQSPNGLSFTIEEISSGIALEILPIITQDQLVMLDISINESQFIPSLGNVEQRRARNTIETSARVSDGQTVIIGGLMLRTRAHSSAGIPGVQNIPIAENIFGHQEYADTQTQVVIFITPHRWEPGLDLPLLEQDSWSIYNQQPVPKDHE